MNRIGVTIACIVLIGTGAVLHGRATNRWESFTASDRPVAKLHDVAIRYADYAPTDIPSEMPVMEKSRVTCTQFVSTSLNTAVTVSLTTGIAGSVAVHTPDVCYVGSGYTMTQPPSRQTIELPGGKSATYYVAEFEKKRATGTDRQRVRWAWTVDGQWEAPDSPRFRYLRAGELAKVYIVTPLAESSAVGSAIDSPAVRDFTAQVFAQYSAALAR
jgi:hypothetical protein